LDWDGINGEPHWRRICENGFRLADATGVNRKIIKLFAYLHNARRLNDGRDLDHGSRVALFIRELAGSMLKLEPMELTLLIEVCRYHTDGRTTGDVTVMTCWDADRLDLGRVGIHPHPDYLCLHKRNT
jgi:uncharacterized protein